MKLSKRVGLCAAFLLVAAAIQVNADARTLSEGQISALTKKCGAAGIITGTPLTTPEEQRSCDAWATTVKQCSLICAFEVLGGAARNGRCKGAHACIKASYYDNLAQTPLQPMYSRQEGEELYSDISAIEVYGDAFDPDTQKPRPSMATSQLMVLNTRVVIQKVHKNKAGTDDWYYVSARSQNGSTNFQGWVAASELKRTFPKN